MSLDTWNIILTLQTFFLYSLSHSFWATLREDARRKTKTAVSDIVFPCLQDTDVKLCGHCFSVCETVEVAIPYRLPGVLGEHLMAVGTVCSQHTALNCVHATEEHLGS